MESLLAATWWPLECQKSRERLAILCKITRKCSFAFRVCNALWDPPKNPWMNKKSATCEQWMIWVQIWGQCSNKGWLTVLIAKTVEVTRINWLPSDPPVLALVLSCKLLAVVLTRFIRHWLVFQAQLQNVRNWITLLSLHSLFPLEN